MDLCLVDMHTLDMREAQLQMAHMRLIEALETALRLGQDVVYTALKTDSAWGELQEHRSDAEPELLKKMREHIFRHGAAATVNSTAETLGMTLTQLRNFFRKVMQSLPDDAVHYSRPAGFIAAELTGIAARHLRESDLEITRIAELLKFNNIYTFSRFFKHNTGLSPQSYRKKNRIA